MGISFGATPGTASAVTYLQGVFFGQGGLEGQVVTTYGQYVLGFLFFSPGWLVSFFDWSVHMSRCEYVSWNQGGVRRWGVFD